MDERVGLQSKNKLTINHSPLEVARNETTDLLQSQFKITLTRKLANGGNSEIYIGNTAKSKSIYIFKVLFKIISIEGKPLSKEGQDKLAISVKREADYTFNLRDKRIVRFMGFYNVDPAFVLVLEYAPNKDLHTLLYYFTYGKRFPRNNYPTPKNDHSSNSLTRVIDWKMNRFSENMILWFARQIISALRYLKLQNLVHRDVKPDNVFVFTSYRVKLGDLALLKEVFPQNLTEVSSSGTTLYIAPECYTGIHLEAEDYHKQDIFAYGVLVFRLATYRYPTYDKNAPNFETNLYNQIAKNLQRKRLLDIIDSSREMTKELKNHILSTLEFDYKKRKGFQDLEKDDFLQDQYNNCRLDCKIFK